MNNQTQFIELLKTIFQFNKNKIDLDFGVYKIFKYRENEITDFIENKLPEIIKEAIHDIGDYDIYRDVLNFFNKYYDQGDFYPVPVFSKNKHHIFRHNGEEVIFSWANRDQYYIKSVSSFQEYKITDIQIKSRNKAIKNIKFSMNEIEEEKGSTKTGRSFVLSKENLPHISEDGESFIIYFDYKKSKTAVQLEEISEILNKNKLSIENLEFHYKKFINLHKADFFIHKDLETFLAMELDYYVKSVIIDLDKLEVEDFLLIKKAIAIKKIGLFIIKFLASMENLQKLLWEKKKFAYDVNYIITLDKIQPSLLKRIVGHRNFNKQVEEWKELGLISKFAKTAYLDKVTKEIKKEYKYLPLDTAILEDQNLIYEILEYIENIDETIDGILINSDNFHGLKHIGNKYQNRIKSVYIDPPYNTGSDGFVYKDSYRESSWLSMMENRLSLIKPFFNDDNALFISIDDRELCNLKLLMESIYADFVSKTIAIKMAEPTGKKMASVVRTGSIPKLKEYGLIYKKEMSGFNFERIPKEKWDNEYKTLLMNITKKDIDYIRQVRNSEIYTDKDLTKIDNILRKIEFISLSEYAKTQNIKINDEWKYKNAWRIVRDASLEGGAKVLADKKNKFTKGAYQIVTPKKKMYFIKAGYNKNVSSPRIKLLFADDYLTVHCGDIWSDIKTTGLDNEGYIEFLNGKKPLKLIKRFISSLQNSNQIILDFFAGSGTTAQAVIQNNIMNNIRDKVILIETNEYFKDKLLKRIKYSLAKEKYPSVFKYFKLEQYEDTLENTVFNYEDYQDIEDYKNGLKPLKEYMSEYYQSSYLNLYEKFGKSHSKSLMMKIDDELLNKPFDFTLKIYDDGALKEKRMDLVETFNTLLGIEVLSIKLREYQDNRYLFVDSKDVVVIWREFDDIKVASAKKYKDDEMKFIKKELVIEEKQIYMNGVCQTHTLMEFDAKETLFALQELLIEE